MTTITWLSTLPLPTVQGYTVQPGGFHLRTEMEAGLAITVVYRCADQCLCAGLCGGIICHLEGWYRWHAPWGRSWFAITLLAVLAYGARGTLYQMFLLTALAGGTLGNHLRRKSRTACSRWRFAELLQSEDAQRIITVVMAHILVHQTLPLRTISHSTKETSWPCRPICGCGGTCPNGQPALHYYRPWRRSNNCVQPMAETSKAPPKPLGYGRHHSRRGWQTWVHPLINWMRPYHKPKPIGDETRIFGAVRLANNQCHNLPALLGQAGKLLAVKQAERWVWWWLNPLGCFAACVPMAQKRPPPSRDEAHITPMIFDMVHHTAGVDFNINEGQPPHHQLAGEIKHDTNWFLGNIRINWRGNITTRYPLCAPRLFRFQAQAILKPLVSAVTPFQAMVGFWWRRGRISFSKKVIFCS